MCALGFLDFSGELRNFCLRCGDTAEDETQVGGGLGYGRLEFFQSPLLRGEFGPQS